MHQKYTTTDYVGFAIAGVAATISILYIAFGWKALGSFLSDAATASWVQAIGSIGAIIGAIWIASQASLEARKRAHDSAKGVRNFAIKLVDDVRHLCSLRTTYIPQFGPPQNIDPTGIKMSFQQIAEPLRSAPIWQMEDLHLASELGSIVYQIGLVTNLLGSDPMGAGNQIELLESTCQKLIDKYGLPGPRETK